MASIIPITLKSPRKELEGSAGRREKNYLKISKEGEKKKVLGTIPKYRQIRKTFTGFQTKKKKTKPANRGNIYFHQTLARKAEQSSARQSPAGVTAIRFLAWGSSLQDGQGTGCPQRSWDDK